MIFLAVKVYRSSGANISLEKGETMDYTFRIFNDTTASIKLYGHSFILGVPNSSSGSFKLTHNMWSLVGDGYVLKQGESLKVLCKITALRTGTFEFNVGVNVYNTKGTITGSASSLYVTMNVTPPTNHISASLGGVSKLQINDTSVVNVTFTNSANFDEKVNLANVLFGNTVNVNHEQFNDIIPANASKTVALNVTGKSIGNSVVSIVYDVLSSDGSIIESNIIPASWNINVTEPSNYLQNVSIINEDVTSNIGVTSKFNYTFENIFSKVTLKRIELNLTEVTSNNVASVKLINNNKETEEYTIDLKNKVLNKGDKYTLPFYIKMISAGMIGVEGIVVYDTGFSEKTLYFFHEFKVMNNGTVTESYNLSNTKVTVGTSLYLNTILNANNATNNSEKITITLPSGLTAEDNSQYIIINSEKIVYGKETSIQKLIKTIKPGSYTIKTNKGNLYLTVDPLEVGKVAFDSNYVRVNPASMKPHINSDLIVSYEVTNKEYLDDKYFPLTIPQTTISLPNQLIFGNGAKRLTIPNIELQKTNPKYEKTYNIILDDNYRNKSKQETLRINCSNSLLGSFFLDVISNPSFAELKGSLSNTTQPSFLDFINNLSYTFIFNIVNTGEIAGKLTEYTLSITGDNATFSDGSKVLKYSNNTGINIAAGGKYQINAPVKITSHSKSFVIQLQCNEITPSVINHSVYVNPPSEPYYNYDLHPTLDELILYTKKYTELSELTIVITNTNTLESKVGFQLTLPDGLKFADDTNKLSVSDIKVGENETVYYKVNKKIKGVSVGNHVLNVKFTNNDEISTRIIVKEPPIESEGKLDIINSKFADNSGSTGGVIYNLSNLTYTNCDFINNSANKCKNIYDKGVCR